MIGNRSSRRPWGERDGLFDRFAFGDAAKRRSLVRSIGGARLGGMYGTGPATAPESAASAAWEAAYVDEHGALPVRAYVKELYDATVALTLAAQAAGVPDGAAIRDRLRAVGGGPGTVVSAGPGARPSESSLVVPSPPVVQAHCSWDSRYLLRLMSRGTRLGHLLSYEHRSSGHWWTSTVTGAPVSPRQQAVPVDADGLFGLV